MSEAFEREIGSRTERFGDQVTIRKDAPREPERSARCNKRSAFFDRIEHNLNRNGRSLSK